jgi:hypothetical protein
MLIDYPASDYHLPDRSAEAISPYTRSLAVFSRDASRGRHDVFVSIYHH